jgi:hypothetical protein
MLCRFSFDKLLELDYANKAQDESEQCQKKEPLNGLSLNPVPYVHDFHLISSQVDLTSSVLL